MSARVSAGEAGNSEGSDAESLTEWKDRIRSSVSEKYVPKYKFQRSLSESAGWQGIFNTYPEVKLTISLLEVRSNGFKKHYCYYKIVFGCHSFSLKTRF